MSSLYLCEEDDYCPGCGVTLDMCAGANIECDGCDKPFCNKCCNSKNYFTGKIRYGMREHYCHTCWDGNVQYH